MTAPTATGDLWLRRYRQVADPAVRLVCFPHAGGSASAYLPFARTLPDFVEVLAVQYPGRQDRRQEPFLESVDTLVDHVLPDLEPWLDRPLALFGHSLGSLLAYETARRLMARGPGAPAHLLVSGRVGPTVPRGITTHLLGDDQLIAKVAELRGTDPRVLADEELLRLALPVIRNDYRVAASYTWRPGPRLACPLTVLTAVDDPHVPADGARAWHQQTTGPTAYHSWPGGHFYLNEHTTAVCRVIEDALRPLAAPPRPAPPSVTE
ncbi:thioesterase domain-containing protein [Streptomyces sp. UNOB3_S3]|uniref:thioesterase II family protein n=1 Tax=Streptomyces sp. UNOB3_S3 TaxID=2871682 RepID=UPI001E413B19|nr:thioesterase domain-containing protein [Streptomyces sp. UNOB3_S3]